MKEVREITNYTKILKQSSLKLNKNSKGFTYSIKAYAVTVEGIESTARSLIDIAEKIIKEKEKKNE